MASKLFSSWSRAMTNMTVPKSILHLDTFGTLTSALTYRHWG
jgi:hypothetical protein